MKNAALLLALVALPLLVPAPASAQDPPIPPYYQLYGGLFYPGREGFRQEFGSPSDFVWGMGMGLPVSPDFLYLIADLSWFRAKALVPGSPDVNAELSQKFWHVGLLNKYFIGRTVAFRFQGGVNFNSAEYRATPAGGAGTTTELKRKPGFFGGAGIENQIGGGRMAIFVDAVYDYRRSTEPSMNGDFGGIRIVAGLAAFWF